MKENFVMLYFRVYYKYAAVRKKTLTLLCFLHILKELNPHRIHEINFLKMFCQLYVYISRYYISFNMT